MNSSIDRSSDERSPVELLADEFLARCKRGEKPAIKEYCDRHPELATEIRDVFEALLMVEDLRPASDEESDSLDHSVHVGGKRLDHVGDYRILREIGRGGMGVVYEAEQRALGRQVALKVLPKSLAADAKALIRFQREAKAAARMHHTNIVPVFDVGQDGDCVYYAMQLIHGQGLDLVIQELKRLRAGSASTAQAGTGGADRSIAASLMAGRFEQEKLADASSSGPDETAAYEASPPSSAVLPGYSELSAVETNRRAYYRSVAQIGLQTASALSYAHARGIIHRDIKPGNLLLDAAGNVWITDFGLAKTGDGGMTHTGDVIGTIRYMSPERFKGQCDVRSDVYGLGMSLYEMLTLKAGYASSDRFKLIEQIRQTEPASPRSVDSRIPRDLETIVVKAIDKDPRRRYQSADELEEDLQRFVVDEPIKARRIGPGERLVRWCRRNPTVAVLTSTVFVLLACVAVGSTVAALWLQTERDAALAAEDRARKEGGNARAAEARAREEEDAKTEKLYQSYVEAAKASRFSRQAGQRFATLDAIGKAAQLARDCNMPSGRFEELRNLAIACLALPDVQLRHAWEGLPEGSLDWDVDYAHGRFVRSTLQGQISVRRMDDDVEVAAMTFPANAFGVRFGPGGRFLRATGHRLQRVWDLEAATPTIVLDAPEEGYAVFHPDGRHLIFVGSDGAIHEVDLTSPKQPARLVARLTGSGSLGAMAVDAGGTRLAVIQQGTAVVVDLKTGKVLARVGGVGAYDLAWHPGGHFLALIGVNHTIYVWDVDRLQRVSVLQGARNAGIRLGFSPDGELLLSAGWEGKLRFWDWRTGHQVLRLPRDSRLQLSRDWRLFTIHGKQAELFDVAPGREYRSLVRQSNTARDLDYWSGSIHSGGRLFAVSMSDGIRLWDLATSDEVGLIRLPQNSHAAFATKDGLLTNGGDGLLYWPIRHTTSPATIVIGPPQYWQKGTWLTIGISRDGAVVAQPTHSGAVVLHKDRLDRPVTLGPQHDTRGARISPDGRFVATASHGGTGGIKLWEIAGTPRLVREMAVGPISSGVFSPDGKWYVGGGNYSAWILRVGSWEQQPARRWVGGVAFSPDSRILAVESGAGAIHLLDPATGREKARLDDPNQDVADSLVFTPDGTRLVAVSNDGQAVHVWDLRLIREQLADLGLDWDEPAYPPAAPAQPAETLRVTVVGDELTYNPGPMLAWEAQECSLQLLRNPLDARLYSQRGRVFAQLNDPMKALADLSFALALQPDQPGARFLRGKLQQQRREWQAAIDDYTFLLQRQPTDPQVRGLRGVCREALGDDVEAARDLGEWIKYGNENAVRLNNLAWRLIRYSKESKNAELALPLIEQANRQWPNQYSLVHTLGVNYYRLSRYSEALSTLERAGKLDNAGPTAAVLYFQAMCRFKLDDHAGAQRDFDLAVRWHEHAKLTPPLVEEMQSFRAEAAAVLKKVAE